MPSQKTPVLSQGELFANDYPIPNNIAVEQSVQQTLYPTENTSSKHKIQEKTVISSNTTTKLTDFLDDKSPIYQLTKEVDWAKINQELGETYQYNNYHYDVRQLAAMYVLSEQNKQIHSITLSLWLENPYWQFFCGMTYFRITLPFDILVLKNFEEYVNQHDFPTLKELSYRLSTLNAQSIQSLTNSIKNTEKPQKLKRAVKQYPTPSILQPISIHWYQDYLFYVYFLLAIGFWVIYSLIFPANWPKEMLTWKQWQVFSYIVIAYPIVEEIIFRGGIQSWLLKYQWAKVTTLGISIANVLVSILFSILHIIIRNDDHTTYGIIIPSLIFGLFRDRHKHIISCTLLHIFYNMGIFFLLIIPHIK